MQNESGIVFLSFLIRCVCRHRVFSLNQKVQLDARNSLQLYKFTYYLFDNFRAGSGHGTKVR